MKNSVIEILKDVIIDEDGDLDIYELGEVVINWPTVGEGDEEEGVDLENWEIISLTDKEMVMTAGGDWQEPIIFTLVPEDGKLRVKDVTVGFKDGLSHKKIIEILTK